MDTADKTAVKEWDIFHAEMLRDVSVNVNESPAEKTLRINRLEADPEAWFKYYFPNYASSEPADFHKEATARLLTVRRWFELRMWSRELAKSTRTMMEYLYMVLAQKRLKNILLISNSEDNAVRLLLPYKLNLEKNARIINDYGIQVNPGAWTEFEFVTRAGTSFRALGAGQSPRGTRYENYRVDGIIIDDIDTDVECRNERIVKEKFKWIQEAVIPTVSVSGDYLITMCGNRISKNSCVAYAEKIASHIDQVNIRDENGLSSWPQKNSEQDIDDILSMLTYSSQQKEYFNNPVVEGTVFTEMTYGQMRPFKEYRFLVCYTDPSFKDSKKNDFKATVLVGRYKDEFHVLKAFVEQTSTANMIDWHYQVDELVAAQVPVYYYMESNFVQDSLLTKFGEEGIARGKVIPIKGDNRNKDNKFARIEAALEPLNRRGKLVLNKAEETNKHMQRLEEQFLALEPGSSAHDDAPDAVEGGVYILNNKISAGGKMHVSNGKNNRRNLKH